MAWGDNDPTAGQATAKAGWGDSDPVAELTVTAPKRHGLWEDVKDATSGAWDKLTSDAAGDYRAATSEAKQGAPGPVQGAVNALKGLGRVAQLGGDTATLIMSPAAGAVHALAVRPAANVLDALPAPNATHTEWRAGVPHTFVDGKMTPEQQHAANEAAVNNALMAAGPETAPTSAAAAAKATNALTDTAARFRAADVTPIPAAAGGKGISALTNAVAENPIAGVAVRNRLRNAVTETADSAQNLAGRYGDARGPQITGENVQSGVQRFARDRSSPTTFASKAEDLYDRAFTPINIAEQQAVERSATDFEARSAAAQQQHEAALAQHQDEFQRATEDYKNAADLRNARMGNFGTNPEPVQPLPVPEPPQVAPQRSVVTPTATISTLQQLKNRVNAPNLSNLITDSRVGSILDALSTDAPDVRFNDLRALRTWVRNAQQNPELRQGITNAGLQQLEQSLTTDIYNNAERLGGRPVLQNLQRADAYYKAGMNRIKTALQPFADARSGEGAYSRVVQAAGSTASADAQKLLSLKRSLAPHEWGDVAANVVSDMGKPTPGAAPAEGGGFSVNTFVTNYNKLSPRGKEVLFGSVGGGGRQASELRASLDNLAFVADSLKRLEKGANTSKSAVSAQSIGTMTGILYPHTTIPTALGLGGMALTGEILTNPAAVNWVAKLARATAGGRQAVNVTVDQLGRAARVNARLAPLYQQSMKLLSDEDVSPVTLRRAQARAPVAAQ